MKKFFELFLLLSFIFSCCEKEKDTKSKKTHIKDTKSPGVETLSAPQPSPPLPREETREEKFLKFAALLPSDLSLAMFIPGNNILESVKKIEERFGAALKISNVEQILSDNAGLSGVLGNDCVLGWSEKWGICGVCDKGKIVFDEKKAINITVYKNISIASFKKPFKEYSIMFDGDFFFFGSVDFLKICMDVKTGLVSPFKKNVSSENIKKLLEKDTYRSAFGLFAGEKVAVFKSEKIKPHVSGVVYHPSRGLRFIFVGEEDRTKGIQHEAWNIVNWFVPQWSDIRKRLEKKKSPVNVAYVKDTEFLVQNSQAYAKGAYVVADMPGEIINFLGFYLYAGK
jgi:hypothetical protein